MLQSQTLTNKFKLISLHGSYACAFSPSKSADMWRCLYGGEGGGDVTILLFSNLTMGVEKK